MTDRLRNFYDTHSRTTAVILFVGLAALAYSNRFVQDDAFISFRYAEHLTRGDGLVWNAGERVEGYTNFLWTLAMAVPAALGIGPVGFSFGLGIAAFILSLYLAYRIARLVLGSRNAALLTVFLLGTNHTFSSYATGGMETQWQACLFTASVFLLLQGTMSRFLSPRRLAALSCVLALAVLTRIDSAVLVVWAFAVAGLALIREEATRWHRMRVLSAITAPFLAVSGSWFIWRLSYYGELLPNTFYAKEPTAMHALRGLYFVGVFLLVYWLLPLALAFPLVLKRRWPRVRAKFELLSIAALVLAWSAYVISVGGDFMEFRFMVPLLPCVFILVAWTIMEWARAAPIRIGLVLLVLCGSVFESNLPAIRGIQTIDGLSQPMAEWRTAGEVLRSSFRDGRDVTIATTAAGTIPYYSRLKTIDMAGLNDRWVARNGTRVSSGYGVGPKIGHQRLATLGYLLERRVNLVIAHPWLTNDDDLGGSRYALSGLLEWSPALEPRGTNQVGVLLGSKIVEIPIPPDRKLLALYLVRNSAVDEAIRAHGWELHSISGD